MAKSRFPINGIRNNWKVVLLSVLGAATFWFFNALNKNYDARITYPLNFSFDRDSVIVVQKLADEVKIDVSSGGWNLLRKTFWFNATPLEINLDNPTDIRYLTRSSLIPIISDQLDGLKLNYVVTDTLFINIEEKITKKLKVQVDSLRLPLEDGFRLTTPIKTTPDTVVVTGPKSIMNIMNLYIWTEFTSTSIDNDFDDEVSLVLPNKRLVSAAPDEVTVKFDVERFVDGEISITPESLNFPVDSSAYLADSLIILKYVIPRSKSKDVLVSDFNVTADFAMLNAGDSTITPMLTLSPEHAIEITMEPEVLKVVYEQK